MHYLINNWPDIKLNLVCDAFTLIIELGLTYFLIDLLLDRREKKRWKPVHRIVVTQLARTYSSIFSGSREIARRVFEQDTPMPPDRTAQIVLAQITNNFTRLQNLIDINNVGLTSELMPKFAVFLNHSEEILKKLKFFSELYDPSKARFDLVGESPIKELMMLELVAKTIREDYKDIFSDSDVILQHLWSAGQISEIWKTAVEKSGRIYLDPEHYQLSAARMPLVYDVSQLRRIPTKNVNLSENIQVSVYYSA